jgi:hypothetical protein
MLKFTIFLLVLCFILSFGGGSPNFPYHARVHEILTFQRGVNSME